MNFFAVGLFSLSAMLTISGVASLYCYSCTDVKNNTLCNQQPAVICNSSSLCFTQIDKAVLHNVKITKKCVHERECNPTNYNVLVASKHTSCCSGDFCNEYANGKTNVTCNIFLIMAAVLVLGIFKKME
ncbi:lymphocyte antigen 6E-like [Lithobates pipiens]